MSQHVGTANGETFRTAPAASLAGPPARHRLALRRWSRACAEAAFDTGAWTAALVTAFRLLHGTVGAAASAGLGRAAVALCVLVPACGLGAGLYRGRFQRGSLDEVAGIILASMASALCLAVTAPLTLRGQGGPPAGLALAAGLLAGAAMLGARYAVFAARLRTRPADKAATKIIVFGAGDAGALLIRRLVTQPGAAYVPVAVLDDDPDKRQLRIHGVPVLGDRTKMAEVAARTGAPILVIALAGTTGPVIRAVTAQAEGCGLVAKVIPSVKELLSGGAKIDGVRDPRITDLLGRRPVETDAAAVRDAIRGRRVLVTGAGGSIGSELCRQLHALGGADLIMLDYDESALHALQLELHGRALLDSEETVLANIRDARRVREVFEQHRPHIVFHAAAKKHLPLLERYPAEALKTNVWGTHNVLIAAAACGVESFVNISTDKAADPTSVLGYSKRIAERLTAHMAEVTGRCYLSVRFGNVLGSRGSVLTTLSAQVAAGGPVTVTHPDVDRYFMTADEAVQLVLQAAVIGSGGEVLVLDMGTPVRIADIARRLAGSTERPVEVVFTGLRPGEKISEALLGDGERDRRPHHPLISQVAVPGLAPEFAWRLDAGLPAPALRAALAACAGAPAAQAPGTPAPPPDAPATPAPGAPTAPPPVRAAAKAQPSVATRVSSPSSKAAVSA